MSDQNIFVSEGTCYTAAGKKLDASFIPCGNDAFGHQTCCGAGDNCIADNACFGVHGSGYGSFLTYMAGCTDPDYKDASCPNKENIDQPWIALTLCDNSDGAWAACSQEGNPSTLQPGSFCSCTDKASATVAFSDSNSLSNICSLPQSTGDSIQFFAGHIPTTPSSAATTAAPTTDASSGGTTTTQGGSGTTTQGGTGSGSSGTSSSPSPGSSGGSTTASQTGSNSSSPSSTSAGGTTSPTETSTGTGTSSGAKIGIGVGAAIGALVLLAAIAALLFLRRKRRRSPSELEKGTANGTKSGKLQSSKNERASATSATPRASEADGQAISEADGKGVSKADRPGVSEADGQALLEADGKGVSKADKPGVSEADGQAVSETDGRAARPWSMRSELEGSPVLPNLAGHPGVSPVAGDGRGGRVRRSGELSPVAELPGIEGWPAAGHAPAQGTGNTTTQGAGRSRWGEAWRVR
ncbi:hypothetical protein BJ170DRAFT_679738 [Xylariales sp. AK1849]|nr:hypothetical protein BJ170DRAFT_679738 [Xylariales sp. AK1849]